MKVKCHCCCMSYAKIPDIFEGNQNLNTLMRLLIGESLMYFSKVRRSTLWPEPFEVVMTLNQDFRRSFQSEGIFRPKLFHDRCQKRQWYKYRKVTWYKKSKQTHFQS